MTLISEITKKISVAEMLTIIFIVSVGISLLYKYGFYQELGIEWYLYTLSPQQLFLSSISLVLFSILGVILGVLNSIYSEKYWESIFILFLILIFLLFFQDYLSWEIPSRAISLLITNTLVFMSIFKLNFEISNIQGEIKNLSLFDKVMPPLCSIFIILGSLGVIQNEGVYDAKNITSFNSAKSIIKLKNNQGKWILIDMNGDKVLLMKQMEAKKFFKIVEYKEIEYYSVN